MLRKYTYIFALFSLLGFTAGCSDDLETGQAASNGKGLSLQIAIDNNEENTSSRTELESADPVNNVHSVQIYIFEGTGDEATYLASEPVDWDEDAQKANRKQHTLKYASLRNGKEYTLLGVGMDEQSEATYDITPREGTTLKDAYAKLNTGKGQADIAQSEFFTGTVSFEFRGENTNLESLTLRRRVAGVMLYVKDIPQTIDDKRVTKIKLELGQNQKSSVMLQRDFTNLEWKEPDGQESMGDDSKILTEIDLTNTEEFQYDATKDCYQNVDGTETAYRGVYMLPLNASENTSENTNTFTVKLYGKKDSGDGTLEGMEEELKSFTVRNIDKNTTTFDIRSNYIYCIGKKAEGVDDPISLGDETILLGVENWMPIDHEADSGATRVQALFDDTENEDKIFNCINNRFTVTVLPPSILLKDKIVSIKVSTNVNPTYVLDKDGNTVTIDEDQELKEQGSIGYYKNWLYVTDTPLDENFNAKSAKYDNHIDLKDKLIPGGDACSLTFFMGDYARPRIYWGWKVQDLKENEYSWQGTADDINNINNDYRYVDIVVETIFKWPDENGNLVEQAPRKDVLRIKQYNTITVYYNPQNGENKYTCCGFSREDVDDIGHAWGWNGTATNEDGIYGVGKKGDKYNGCTNVENIGTMFGLDDNWEKWWNNDSYGDCASRTGQYLFRKISDNKELIQNDKLDVNAIKINTKDDRTKYCWYLPAQFELKGLMTLAIDNTQGIHLQSKLKNCKGSKPFYWTSTLSEKNDKAIAYAPNFDNYTCQEFLEEYRSEAYYVRSARRFPEEYAYEW